MIVENGKTSNMFQQKLRKKEIIVYYNFITLFRAKDDFVLNVRTRITVSQ